MNYRQKRNNKRLSLYTVAKELGISRKKYEDIELGKITKMEAQLGVLYGVLLAGLVFLIKRWFHNRNQCKKRQE